MLQDLLNDLNKLKNPQKAPFLQRFFKTGKGQYGEGDVFLGLVVPQERLLAKKYCDLSYFDLQQLFDSRVHEQRLIALFILISQYQRAKELERKKIITFYLRNTQRINNWDLVDLSAPNILGNYLLDKDPTILLNLARSNSLWEKRIAVLSTLSFIRKDRFDLILQISEILLNDKHDLIHNAVGWMLREVGKRNRKVEEAFLNQYSAQMPRTMLRYAIEKFDEEKRKVYLKLKS
jgi:3-methyladenine DNA glycosylase AlkD